MEICFNGTACPIKYLHIGVKNNNLVDEIVFCVDRITSEGVDLSEFTPYVKIQNEKDGYIDKDGKITVGYVSLIDTNKGVTVSFIKNYNPERYSGLGKLADQIEVEHCIKKGLKTFEITSEASLNSHALHYLRGKRFNTIADSEKKIQLLKKFKTFDINKIVKFIIKNTPANQMYKTDFLGQIPMYMPKSLIKKYIEIAKKSPILK